MSTASSEVPATPAQHHPAEPFGQMGVRQYLVPVISWLCVAGIGFCIAVWFRSLSYVDRLEWRNVDQELRLSSGSGWIKIEGATYATRQFGNVGWVYRGSRQNRDRWAPSMYRAIGLEIGLQPERRGANGGFAVRIKWYFVAVMLAIIPFGRELLKWRRSRELHE